MKNENISDLTLERYVLNELPEELMADIEKLIKERPEFAIKIKLIKQSNEEILSRYPEESVTKEIINKYNKGKSNIIIFRLKLSGIKKIMLSSLAVAAAIAIFFAIPALKTSFVNMTENDFPGVTRVKGEGSKLYIYRKTNGLVELLQKDSKASAGDLLQIAYSSASDTYGIILSIDGRSTVTLHYPASESDSQKLIPGKKVLLGNSYELDDAPDFERFFFITSDSEMDIKSVIFTAEVLAVEREKAKKENLVFRDSMKNVNQVSILIIKE